MAKIWRPFMLRSAIITSLQTREMMHHTTNNHIYSYAMNEKHSVPILRYETATLRGSELHARRDMIMRER